jgi:hypothetical protein
MKKGYLIKITLIASMAFLISCSGVDIRNDAAVLKDIQGIWTGYEFIGGMYRHIKLKITENDFDGWIQTSDSVNEPTWTDLPGEIGTISISSVTEDPDIAGKFRRITFKIRGTCCGDNSSTAWTLSKLITYNDGKGLLLAGRTSMARK